MRGEQQLLTPELQEITRARYELLMVDRTLQKVGRARLKGVHTEGALLVNRDNDDRDFRAVRQFTKFANERRAIHLRHFIVGDDEVGSVFGHEFQRRLCIGKGMHCDVLRN